MLVYALRLAVSAHEGSKYINTVFLPKPVLPLPLPKSHVPGVLLPGAPSSILDKLGPVASEQASCSLGCSWGYIM